MPITVFYTPRMVADSQSYSPSARKPEQVVQSWLQLGLPLRVVEPEPVTRDQLCLAHSPAYVDGVLSTQKPNGFGAVAPYSGFHHAGHGFGGGFCTFNGLRVTACTLLKEARVQRIAILDLDMHYGNGTVDIIDLLGLNDRIAHHSAAPLARPGCPWRGTWRAATSARTTAASARCSTCTTTRSRRLRGVLRTCSFKLVCITRLRPTISGWVWNDHNAWRASTRC